jgi:hypothetical protein
MTIKLPEISFSSFLYVATVAHLIFAVPSFFGILLFDLINIKAALFIYIFFALTGIPLSAAIAWLFAKGSNWKNSIAAITAMCSLPGRIYGSLFGGLLGFHYFNTIGGIIGVVLFTF